MREDIRNLFNDSEKKTTTKILFTVSDGERKIKVEGRLVGIVTGLCEIINMLSNTAQKSEDEIIDIIKATLKAVRETRV